MHIETKAVVKQSEFDIAGVWVDVCLVTEDMGIPFLPGWYQWVEGTPLAEYIPKEKTGRIKIAKAGNPKHRRYLRDQAQLHRKAMRTGRLTVEAQDAIETQGIASFLLLGFERFTTTNDKGDDVPLVYSHEVASNWLRTDKQFLDFVSELVQDDALFEDANESVKNSKPS